MIERIQQEAEKWLQWVIFGAPDAPRELLNQGIDYLVAKKVYCPNKCKWGFLTVGTGEGVLLAKVQQGGREHEVRLTGRACRKCRKIVRKEDTVFQLDGEAPVTWSNIVQMLGPIEYYVGR